MSRPLRIEYPGAWYHVMNRGRRSEKIFYDKEDYQLFVALLEETSEMWNIRISAYCLMPNHYHILLQTPDGKSARSMRHINGVYTQRFNRRHGVDGQLFRGRYKSMLVGADNYLLQLVRYIHRNPVKAGFVKVPEDYAWSSHKAYLSIAKKWNWLNKVFIYTILTKNKREWIKRYRQFVAIDADDIAGVIEGSKWPTALGPMDFIDWVKGKYYAGKIDDEVPQAKTLAPSGEVIIKRVCDFYGVKAIDLRRTKRGEFNEPRNAAVYLMRMIRRDGLREIGERFEIGKYSTVSSIIEGTRRRLKKERNLKRNFEELHRLIVNGQ